MSRPSPDDCDHHYELIGSHCTLCGYDSQPMWGLEDRERVLLGIACFPAGLFLMIVPHLIRGGPRQKEMGMVIVVGGILIAVGAALLLKVKNSFKL